MYSNWIVFRTADSSIGVVNDGQPVPESYFSVEEKSGDSHAEQENTPARFSLFNGEVKARSVPRSIKT